MSLFSSLDPKDRKLLGWFVGIGLTLATLTGLLMPDADENDNPMPSTYLAGKHGARAAYEMLLQSGYPIERWEQPLAELAATADPETVVILAQPLSDEKETKKAIRQILERGGRVLSTGTMGGEILPGAATVPPKEFNFAACKLDPEGGSALADSGEVWMIPEASWHVGIPAHRVDYSCAGNPAVVEYGWSKGQIVWWASSTPLENGALARAHNLDLFLNSLGPRVGHRFYWDESLHGELRSSWSYITGPSMALLWWGLIGVSLLTIFSFSRRSGPLRDLPAPPRATPIEFLEALGSLYRKAGAASSVMAIAWERFRRQSLRLCGLRGQQMSAAEVAMVIRRRFPQADASLEADLAACEEASLGESITPRAAFKLIQRLHLHRQELKEAVFPRTLRA